MPRFNFRLFSRGASSKQHIGGGDGPSKVCSRSGIQWQFGVDENLLNSGGFSNSRAEPKTY